MTIDARTFHSWTPKASELQRGWVVVDVSGEVLGRAASQIAMLLRGKNKPTYAPHMDGGDFVIVLNAEKIVVTGRKADQKLYYRYTGYPGGLRETTYKVMMQKHPERILKAAVKGMLPKTRLGRRLLRKLHIYSGNRHPHTAQQPAQFALSK
ncbi:MAG: 50S ribosomal protein L13 [Herpetosiphonaceae bacterium]|nr:50S ribosomal protein L13 [Herpetosiphonaceae bacterium]